MYFILYNSVPNEYKFKIVSESRYKTLCHSESFKSKSAAIEAINRIKNGANIANIKDMTLAEAQCK